MKKWDDGAYWLIKKIVKKILKFPKIESNIFVHKFYAISLVIMSRLGLIIGFKHIYFY